MKQECLNGVFFENYFNYNLYFSIYKKEDTLIRMSAYILLIISSIDKKIKIC